MIVLDSLLEEVCTDPQLLLTNGSHIQYFDGTMWPCLTHELRPTRSLRSRSGNVVSPKNGHPWLPMTPISIIKFFSTTKTDMLKKNRPQYLMNFLCYGHLKFGEKILKILTNLLRPTKILITRTIIESFFWMVTDGPLQLDKDCLNRILRSC